jgi:hypothetical protein
LIRYKDLKKTNKYDLLHVVGDVDFFNVMVVVFMFHIVGDMLYVVYETFYVFAVMLNVFGDMLPDVIC